MSRRVRTPRHLDEHESMGPVIQPRVILCLNGMSYGNVPAGEKDVVPCQKQRSPSAVRNVFLRTRVHAMTAWSTSFSTRTVMMRSSSTQAKLERFDCSRKRAWFPAFATNGAWANKARSSMGSR